MDPNLIIRLIDKSEISELDKFLYEAIFIAEGQVKPDRNIIRLPELSIYTKDFGKEDDICFVAELHGKLIGAIWTRIFTETEHGFGYVDSKTPELSMSVLRDYRQKGIGTLLLKTMIDKLVQCNYKKVSLSVDKINHAINMYRRFGFKTLVSEENSVTMIKVIKDEK